LFIDSEDEEHLFQFILGSYFHVEDNSSMTILCYFDEWEIDEDIRVTHKLFKRNRNGKGAKSAVTCYFI
jgi:hypothetical protein